MSNARKRKLLAAALAVGAGTLFQYLPHGCANYALAQALTAFDFCAVLNCQGGTFFDMCQPVALLMDCPKVTATTSTGGTTTGP